MSRSSGESFKRKLLRFSLTLVGTMGGLALVTGVALWWLVVPALKSRFELDTQYLARELAERLEIAAAAEDVTETARRVAGFVQDPDFGGVAVRLADGRLLYTYPEEFAPGEVAPGEVLWSEAFVQASHTIEVEGIQLGRVTVAHSTLRIHAVSRWFLAFGGLVLAYLGFAAAFAIRFDRRFVGPLRELAHFARRIEDGDLDARLDSRIATAEAQDLAEHLNRMAGALTAKRKALVAAREEAEAMSEVKSRFLANMSHEMRTPLNGVIGMLELVLDEPLDASLRDELDIVHASAKGLLDIIEDVLDISKIEAGELEVEQTEVELAEILRGAVFAVVTRAAEHGNRVVVDLGPDVPSVVHSDPVRLRQVVLNLLSNATKFTEDGEIRVVVRRRDAMLEIAVQDQGIGMSPEQLARAFVAFRQADVSTTRKYGGTGLGLAISRNLARLLGGDLDATSEVGKGSCFTLRIPLHAGERPRPPDRAVAVLGEEPERSALEQRLVHAGAKAVPPERAELLVLSVRSTAAADSLAERLQGLSAARVGVVQAQQRGKKSPLGRFPELPLLIEPAFASEILQVGFTPDPKDTSAPPSFAGRRVLVAEDNPVNQKVVARALARLGIDVTLAGDGAAAVASLARAPACFDLVLMDLQMPVMDGLEATRRIRAAGHALPIVALTADAMTEAWTRCQAAGMNDFLTKPLRRSDLADKLRSLL